MRHIISVLPVILLTACCEGNYETRLKRSLARVGNTALRKLLKDSKILKYDPPTPTLFSKDGGYRQAVKDFRSVKPKDVQHYTMRLENGDVVISGRVGNRGIQLVKGTEDRPTMLNVFRLPENNNEWAKDHLGIVYKD